MKDCAHKNTHAVDVGCKCVCTCTDDYICSHCKWCDDVEYHLYMPKPFVKVDEFIMLDLIDEGFVIKSMSDKEFEVQVALGTAPEYRSYLIIEEAA